MGNAVCWTIGRITAIIIGFSPWDLTALANLKDVTIGLLAAGVIGAGLVFGIAWVIPQIGTGTAFFLMVAGQVIAGMTFSHFGILRSPVDHTSLIKLVGVLLVIGGAGIVSFSK